MDSHFTAYFPIFPISNECFTCELVSFFRRWRVECFFLRGCIAETYLWKTSHFKKIQQPFSFKNTENLKQKIHAVYIHGFEVQLNFCNSGNYYYANMKTVSGFNNLKIIMNGSIIFH